MSARRIGHGAGGGLSRYLSDERFQRAAIQLLVAACLLLVFGLIAHGVLEDLRANNLAPGLGFLNQTAGFGIAEGISFSEGTDTYRRAFVVGLVNTLKVAVIGIVLATPLGVFIALARLSGNPLVTGLAGGYIELMRNTPLLVQLLFWYQGVFLQLPSLADAHVLGAGTSLAILSQRGVALPQFVAREGAMFWWMIALAALVVAGFVFLGRGRGRGVEGAGPSGHRWMVAIGLLSVAATTGWLLLRPYEVITPYAGRFRYEAGLVLSPEMAALLVGLVAYTGAFIAEVVRGGIQSVTRGQTEAAHALGLKASQAMRLVILPQALRVILPPLTNQYLNLTKNSSLAIFIGYPDLFNIGLTIGNNTGQFVIVTAMMMAVYLGISLLTSVIMSRYNERLKLVER